VSSPRFFVPVYFLTPFSRAAGSGLRDSRCSQTSVLSLLLPFMRDNGHFQAFSDFLSINYSPLALILAHQLQHGDADRTPPVLHPSFAGNASELQRSIFTLDRGPLVVPAYRP